MSSILKYKNSDFRVKEVNYPAEDEAGSIDTISQKHIYLLRKEGITTFRAIELLSDYFDCKVSDVHYFGLKDEDGQTEQQITLDFQVDGDKLCRLNEKYKSKLNLVYFGRCSDNARIGNIVGNVFTIIVRNLSPALLDEKLTSHSQGVFDFINYYDEQRFGVPGGPKITHLIGMHLLESDFSKAFEYLIKNKSDLARDAQEHQDGAISFFEKLDIRTKMFFLNSYSSYCWNQSVVELLDDYSQCAKLHGDPMDLLILKRNNSLKLPMMLDYLKYRIGPDGIESSNRPRPLQHRVIYKIRDIADDEHHTDKKSVKLEFFLPSGSYATMFIKQFLVSNSLY